MGMPSQPTFVRILVGAALSASILACVALPIPANLPSVALKQPGLYRLEVGLMVLYGCLLIVTPAYSGLSAGRLPIEHTTALLREGLERARFEIRQLDARRGDKT
jgi:hypothetical protein